jgi:hypothetical protein
MAARVYSILRGSFLTSDDAFKNWRFIAFVTLLAMIMIYTGHSLEKKVFYMAQLTDRSNQLRSEYMDGQRRLMFLQMESEVKKNLKDSDIKPAYDPPKKLVVASVAKPEDD